MANGYAWLRGLPVNSFRYGLAKLIRCWRTFLDGNGH